MVTKDYLRAAVFQLWKQGLNTAEIASVLQEPEAFVEKELHAILDEQWIKTARA